MFYEFFIDVNCEIEKDSGGVSANDVGGIEERKRLSSRIASVFKGRNTTLLDYDRSNFRRYWMPDSSGRECYECQERFTAFRRRHHCRLCGQIFCSKCCDVQVPGSLLVCYFETKFRIIFGYTGDLRLCTYCAQIVVSNLPQIETKMENKPTSSCNDQKSVHESDVSVSTIFAVMGQYSTFEFFSGPVSWSLNSPIATNSDDDSLFQKLVMQRSSLTLDRPAELSVTELATYNSIQKSSAQGRFDVGDDHEPEWVKNIEMTDNVKPVHSSNLKSRPIMDYCRKEDTSSKSDFYGTDLDCNKKGTKISSSDDTQFSETIERCFEMHAEKLILHLFKRERLDPAEWWDIIWTVSHVVSSMVKVDMEGRKAVSVMKHTHIKSLHVVVDKPSAKIIEGTVCSKSIRHDSMPDEIDNASLLILEGSLEYERVNDKLSSIEPIISQENEYLQNQVERMLSHRPSIVIVERNVASLAVQMLLQAGVTLVSNIKPRVLQRIARSTGADLMPSLDAQILHQKIGYCPSFRQKKIYLANGKSKCLLIFGGCSPELGCSILLRSKSRSDLRAAKKILRYAILAFYSNNLEVELLSGHGTILTSSAINCAVCCTNASELDTNMGSFCNRLRKSILSPSPLIGFGIPFLETSKGQRCSLRKFFHRFIQSLSTENAESNKLDFRSCFSLKRLIILHFDCKFLTQSSYYFLFQSWHHTSFFRNHSDSQFEENHVFRRTVHPFVKNVTLTEIDEDEVASFRAFSGHILRLSANNFSKQLLKPVHFIAKFDLNIVCSEEIKQNIGLEDVLDPFAHQQISVLFGSFCAKSPNAPLFCIRPWVVNMEYYGVNDMSLGDFLKKYCFNKAYHCPSITCGLPVMEHCRRLIHRNVCVEIVTQNYVNSNDELSTLSSEQRNNTLISWHYCSKCKSSSSLKILTNNVCRLSFARYLNYLASGSHATCKINTFSQKCGHCCFHEHERNFALNNVVTSFKVLLIKPFHVTFSPLLCTVEPLMFTRKFVVESGEEIQQIAAKIFCNMSEQVEYLSKYNENSLYSTCQAQARKICSDARSSFSTAMSYFDLNGALNEDVITIRSNDAVYTQAVDTIGRCRYILQHAINLWNEQCQYFTQQIRTIKKSSNSKTVNFGFTSTTDEIMELNRTNEDQISCTNNMHANGLDFELIPIDSPFLSEHHFSLPLPAAGLAAVVVRDMIDQKGVVHPDIGSIIAYALSSKEYNMKRRKYRDSIFRATSQSESESGGIYEHIEVDFTDEKAQYYVKIYYAEKFHMLRKLLFVEGEDCFIRSLSSSHSWSPQGGKSGASFYRTQDDRFVFKQMSRFEIQSFVKFGPNYFSYISTAMTDNKLTTLCKVYGVYRICYKNRIIGQQLKIDVLVMEYLFYRRNIKQVWDLKGSQRNRMASEGKRTTDLVLLDENLLKDLWNNQLYVHPHSKAALNMAISNDSHFLSAQHIMDYSLLVGVDERNNELILGIVDYMRTYTLDKKLESWVKIVAIPGAHLPTVISPEMYCTRFSDAIDIYFPVAPDQWTGLRSALPSSDC
ncbi:unnamed protein product [Thelazia callipaeda]|uniref:1-phosphatidylinositol-3-phosphate 5-kinase n=1 Tax=Thelazia callipaeda TaxID=103827 RepID=A0A0N5CPW6_THECL|nr:unnamed protein product [Thelazia callipaeda]